tara:strand:+ start:13876 stop:14967 length:1092 start_codon:yes stop_codon:yes gene_type:complete
MTEKNSEIFAYGHLEMDLSSENEQLINSLNLLVDVSEKISSPLLRMLKPIIALSIKWKFDYLAKTSQSPFLLQQDLDYWIDNLKMLSGLSKQNWFELKGHEDESDDLWESTKKTFNFIWPRNVQGAVFDDSKKMAMLRLEQIFSMMDGGKKFLKNKIIIDSGCGPGRYTDCLLLVNPKKIIGVDSGDDIIIENCKKFLNNKNVEMKHGFCDNLPIEDNYADFVLSVGVLHHLPNPMDELIAEHARILKNDGYIFIYLHSNQGLELKIWEFMRKFLSDIPVSKLFETFAGKISHLRLQGLLDQGKAETQHIDRGNLEKWLRKHFCEIQRVPGIEGLDVTKEIYENDIYFPYRFGTGNLRYLCRK